MARTLTACIFSVTHVSKQLEHLAAAGTKQGQRTIEPLSRYSLRWRLMPEVLEVEAGLLLKCERAAF
jgi:hypothetical protein